MAEKNKIQQKNPSKKEQFDLLGGRVPPHNLDMERAVLCAALIDQNGFSRMISYLDEESFYERRHQLIYQAMSNLNAKGSGIDALTVSDELERTGVIEEAGGDVYLASLTNEVATAAYAEQYAGAVREKYILRRLIKSSTSVALDAYDAPEASELLDRLLKDLFEIYTNRPEGGFKPISAALTATLEYLDEHYKQKGDLTGIGTGFKELDNYTSGFQNGDLIIIAARPSMGKTAFSLDLARNACQIYGAGVAFFSLEMSSMAIAMRILASQARVDLHRLRSGRMHKTELPKLAAATSDLSNSNFFIDDTGSLGLMELRARSRQLKQQHNISLIIIDYLQLMKPPKADSREQEVAQISRGLKGLARELNVPVIALSQLSRAVEQRGGDKRPVLSDLRDSGSIEQDADVVMFIYRERQYKRDSEEEGAVNNTAEIIIRKQRNGPTGTVELIFVPEFARFESTADRSALDKAASFAAGARGEDEALFIDDGFPPPEADDEPEDGADSEDIPF